MLHVKNLDLLGGSPYMILTNPLRVSLATIIFKYALISGVRSWAY